MKQVILTEEYLNELEEKIKLLIPMLKGSAIALGLDPDSGMVQIYLMGAEDAMAGVYTGLRKLMEENENS